MGRARHRDHGPRRSAWFALWRGQASGVSEGVARERKDPALPRGRGRLDAVEAAQGNLSRRLSSVILADPDGALSYRAAPYLGPPPPDRSPDHVLLRDLDLRRRLVSVVADSLYLAGAQGVDEGRRWCATPASIRLPPVLMRRTLSQCCGALTSCRCRVSSRAGPRRSVLRCSHSLGRLALRQHRDVSAA